jgi:hypothetical protein
LDGAFNGVFYELLRQCGRWTDRDRGLDRNEVHDAIQLLSDHKVHLGIDKRQVRGLLGREWGLYDDTGRLRTELINRSGMSATERAKTQKGVAKVMRRHEEAQQEPAESFGTADCHIRQFTSDNWSQVVDEALLIASDKPEQASIQSELRWLSSRMLEWPDFRTAPSRTVIKWWLLLNNPNGVDPAHRDFFKLVLQRRLAPGDGARKQPAAFEEDESNVGGIDHDEESYRRLFGDM